ncbi:DNRLRE domain-containing protein [Kitasatospora sp. NPDC006697]|uniref:CBM96 family carbohydrate-binding protein n=1 Tax=Kitasatospora sp. NPDC006697 TaxID=3364020 RepID=UPI00369C9F21
MKNASNTGSGYNRESLYGNVQDFGGSQTTLQALATTSDTWTESGVTWNTAPARTTALGTGTVTSSPDRIGLDVTGAVAAAPGTRPSRSIRLIIFDHLLDIRSIFARSLTS